MTIENITFIFAIIGIITMIKLLGTYIKRVYSRLFPPKQPNENIIQYIVRQFYLADSRGNPSLTVTILIFIMTLVAIVTIVECRIALSTINVYNEAGKLVSTQLKGFSVSFLSLIISLSVVITAFYRQRSKNMEIHNGSEKIENGNIIDDIKGIASDIFNIGGDKKEGK